MARVGLAIFISLFAATIAKNNCPDQFIQLGSFCYLFSDVEEDWAGARGICEGIGIVHEETVVLAVLDYGISTEDNQLLLTNITERSGRYWLGGKLDEESDIWKWVDHDDREIDLRANYWYSRHPNSEGNCLMVIKESDDYRSYVNSADCSQQSKVICQVIPKEVGFRQIGSDQFYFSAENGIGMKTWEAARNFCLFLEPPNHFNNVDLAVLGFNHEFDQEFLQVVADIGFESWLGGQQLTGSGNNFTWVDDRSIDETLYFFDPEHSAKAPHSYTYRDWVTYANVTSVNGHSRSALKLCCLDCDTYDVDDRYECDEDKELHFVCQAFKL